MAVYGFFLYFEEPGGCLWAVDPGVSKMGSPFMDAEARKVVITDCGAAGLER
jgi:hypothetical protein